jgi:hypothetical protein
LPCRRRAPAPLRRGRFTLVLLAVLLCAPPGGSEDRPGWQLSSRFDGITVYYREIPNSPVVGLRAETVIDAPIGKLMTVLDQIERFPEWVPYVTQAQQRRASSFYVRTIFFCGKAPWPVADREFLVYSRLEIDPSRRQLTVRMGSIEDPEVPVGRGRVRGELHSCLVTLRSVDLDSRTFVSVEVRADPKGWIPKWIVNWVQTRWPRMYLMALRAQARRPDIRMHPRSAQVLGVLEPTRDP